MGRRDRVTDSVVLETGRTVRLRATRIVVGDEVAGIVLLLDEERAGSASAIPVPRREGGPPAGTAPLPPAAAGGRAPAWTAACAQITGALGRGQPLLVLGEPGTGKATLVTEIFAQAQPAGRVVTVEADTAFLVGLPDAGPALVVLRHLDRVGADGVEGLRAVLSALDRDGVDVAATLDAASAGADLPFQGVLGRFGTAVTLPPLRFRTGDLPLVVARLLSELAPDRRVRLHPEALRLLTRHPWPRNTAQVREALQLALVRRPVGEIRPEDLPGWCRAAATRTLRPIEVAERDAIVAALQECMGNRVQAAVALGMARSSLYRKIKSYGITEA
nr:helix-turn-helix domain-containing protein [Geodermatophilus sabuli]